MRTIFPQIGLMLTAIIFIGVLLLILVTENSKDNELCKQYGQQWRVTRNYRADESHSSELVCIDQAGNIKLIPQ